MMNRLHIAPARSWGSAPPSAVATFLGEGATMNRLRRTFFVALIGACSVLLPAEKSEAGLVDWLRCVFCPWRACDPCAPVCDVPACPPVVQEGSYCNPCPTPCDPCPVSYVRRTYLEPRTVMARQTTLEPRPTYVRRRYWDPCSRCYKTYFETSTSYCKRTYCVPVTNYVQRSYLEPASCVTPSCPTDTCPVAPPVTPLTPAPLEPTTIVPSASSQGSGNSTIGDADRRLVSPQPFTRYPASPRVPGRSRYLQPSSAGA